MSRGRVKTCIKFENVNLFSLKNVVLTLKFFFLSFLFPFRSLFCNLKKEEKNKKLQSFLCRILQEVSSTLKDLTLAVGGNTGPASAYGNLTAPASLPTPLHRSERNGTGTLVEESVGKSQPLSLKEQQLSVKSDKTAP